MVLPAAPDVEGLEPVREYYRKRLFHNDSSLLEPGKSTKGHRNDTGEARKILKKR
jgi:hypothetical protein